MESKRKILKSPKSWDEYWLDQLDHVASKSKDPHTKVGAIIVDMDNEEVGKGYNGFPPKLIDYEDRWQRPEKYKWAVHAEVNAICNSKRSVKGCKIYLPFWPCERCVLVLATAGIKEVHVRGDYYRNEVAETVFQECDIEIIKHYKEDDE